MKKLGFIGLGSQGAPMARRMIDAGHEVVDVTLKSGVEKTLMERIPELKGVRDKTDHTVRDNAYYK